MAIKDHHPANERIKRKYYKYLEDARGYSDETLDSAAAAVSRFETYTGFKSFDQFKIEQATGFKKHLAERTSRRTGEPLSKATIASTLGFMKGFAHWLAEQSGYRRVIRHSDADYFSLSQKESRLAKTHRNRPVPSLEQIQFLLKSMAAGSEGELRNRALIATTILTGARDGALVTLKLKHLDIDNRVLIQDPNEVNTKFAKSQRTWFFPVGDDPLTYLAAWRSYLANEKMFGPDDPLFPASKTAAVDGVFAFSGLSRNHWTDATPVQRIFREAFAAAGLPYYNPHSFRKTLATLGERVCQTPEQFKAWSQNLGHEQVMTTFRSYGQVGPERQAQIIQDLWLPRNAVSVSGEMLKGLERILKAATAVNTSTREVT